MDARINRGLVEYHEIVKGIKEEYTKEELTIEIIRKEHEELNFMDDEEIEDMIKLANHYR